MKDLSIGIGVTFPLKVTDHKGESGVYPVEGDLQLITENLLAIFQYVIGQRIRQEDFGNNLISILEEPNNIILDRTIYTYLRMAINTYEPRIRVKDIHTTRSGTSVNILITYSLVSTGSENSVSLSYNIT